MLPTFIIGLREGLEAALIVGIIAAFLRKNGKSLVPMWIGVAAAVGLSVAVGVVLDVIERSLPEAAQEGMECVIGAIAVVFVTGMILWMNTHARGLKRELEAGAGQAIRDGSAYALAGMAFLAVLKEGFETSVFLLATFTASGDSGLAATGAVAGIVASVLIGVGIYAGSVTLNLGTFFRWTGAFLILVAAGLVLQSFRTAHEAGWLSVGQQQVLDLGPAARPGTLVAALLTGVLGIPADPRLIEVIGWLGYLVPVALFVYWPAPRGASSTGTARVRARVVGALTVVAVGLAVIVPLAAPGGRAADVASATDAAAQASVAPIVSGVSQVRITMLGGASDRCDVDHTSAKAGPVTFVLENESSTAITEVELLSGPRIVGEKENLAPGLGSVSFTVTLDGGNYQLYCPGANKELTGFTVTGKAPSTNNGSTGALLKDGTTGYASYVSARLDDLLAGAKRLQAAVDSGNVAQAKSEYAATRQFYEKVESDVAGFIKPGGDPTDNASNLDYLIDMRASNLDPAVGWHGFHALERDLWQGGAITDSTKSLAAELVTNVTTLNQLGKKLSFKPEDLANGAAGLLEEVQANKITGEEEQFSHIDLTDLASNVEGARQAFAYLEPGLTKIDPTATARIQQQFSNVDTVMGKFRDATALGGYITYDTATRNADAKTISLAVQALQEPMSQLAQKVATAS
jgi:iron uptake system component EfeO